MCPGAVHDVPQCVHLGVVVVDFLGGVRVDGGGLHGQGQEQAHCSHRAVVAEGEALPQHQERARFAVQLVRRVHRSVRNGRRMHGPVQQGAAGAQPIARSHCPERREGMDRAPLLCVWVCVWVCVCRVNIVSMSLYIQSLGPSDAIRQFTSALDCILPCVRLHLTCLGPSVSLGACISLAFDVNGTAADSVSASPRRVRNRGTEKDDGRPEPVAPRVLL